MRANRLTGLTLLFSCAAVASSQGGSSTTLAPPWSLFDDDNLTPRERSDRNKGPGGVFEIDDVLHCSRKASRRAVGPVWIPGETGISFTVLGKSSPSIPGYQRNKDLTETVVDALDKLKSLGDTKSGARQLCMGLYEYGAMNARSYSEGYIAVDKRVYEVLYSLPEEKRSSFSVDLVLLHELAHQFQYWWGNPFSADKNVRRTELAADCVAASLLRLRWVGLSPEIWATQQVGVIGAAEKVGDNEYEAVDHHGTSDERKSASLYGVRLIEAPGGPPASPTGEVLLNRCNRFVVQRDAQRPGLPWPPYERFKRELLGGK